MLITLSESDGETTYLAITIALTPLNNGGQERPVQFKDARLSHKSQAVFFDVTAFAPQSLGTVGSACAIRSSVTTSATLTPRSSRHFPVTERVKVQFRAEASSTFRKTHQTTSTLETGKQRGEFSEIQHLAPLHKTDPNYTPREFQFALKAHF